MSQAPTGFTAEQQAYLIQALTRLNLHKAFARGGDAPAAEETYFGVPIEDLCKEEVAKYEMHPLDMWRRLEEWEATGHMAEGLEQYLLRHLGFFNVEPASPGYMMRLRCPGNILRGDQMIRLAEVAEDHAGGYCHVTTRGSLQLREIMPGNVIPIIETLADVGLTAQGTGSDSARNLTCTPTAGVDPQELLDTRPFTHRLSSRILRTRELQGIPRKFNISYDGGGVLSCVSDTNDIAFQAVKVPDNDQGVEPGVWFRIALGGITGHKDFAKDTGLACRPDEAVDVAEAMLRVFVAHGNRTNRAKARLKYVLDDKGADWFCARSQEVLDSFGTGARLTAVPQGIEAPRGPIDRQGHIGVHPQAQEGLNYVGIALEMGRLSAQQMRELGRLAQVYGANDIRLTVWQNPLILGVSDANVAPLQAELAALGLATSATAFAAGAVACTGKWACKLANAYTKQDGLAIIRHLEAKYSLDTPINIHLTGCSNTCAQHYIGDIGLIGAETAEGKEGYNIFLGGGSDQDQGLARFLIGPVAAEKVVGIIDHVVGAYLERRAEGETFLSFTRGLEGDALKSLLPADLAVAA